MLSTHPVSLEVTSRGGTLFACDVEIILLARAPREEQGETAEWKNAYHQLSSGDGARAGCFFSSLFKAWAISLRASLPPGIDSTRIISAPIFLRASSNF